MGLVVLTGASGSGKTTIAAAIGASYPVVEVHHFDSIGVPRVEHMVRDYGSPEGWQRAMTFEWIGKLAPLAEAGRPVLLEGQMRLAFVAEAAEAVGRIPMTTILLDCNDSTRAQRLIEARGQPHLASAEMMDWAAYLRREAAILRWTTLDTSEQTVAESVAAVATQLWPNGRLSH